MSNSTALQIAASAYKQANMDQTLSSFSMTDYPYDIALDLFNTVIQEMNREGHYWFTETETVLTYTPGVYQYNFNTLSIDPKGILRIRKEANSTMPEMKEIVWRVFQNRFRRTGLLTTEPYYWSKFGGLIEFNTIPDKDYQATIYYLKDIPLITTETDTLPCQQSDEDVFREGVYAYLLMRLGRPDANEAYQLYMSKVSSLLADMKTDVGMPRQMPAAF